MVLGIYGASGLGAEIYNLAFRIQKSASENPWTEIIFADDDTSKIGTTFVDLPVFSLEQALQKYGIDGIEFILSIGEPIVKNTVYEKLMANHCKLAKLIHPTASVSEFAELGEGVVVQRNSNVPPLGKIGNNVVIQGTAVLGHGVIIGDNTVISSFAFVGGDTVIGKNTYIGPHSCLRNGIRIGENCVIGMGSVVTKDIPDNAVAYGNPCEVKRINQIGRVFSK